MEIMNVDTKQRVMTAQNSDFRENSKKSLESVAGEVPQQAIEQRSMEKVMDPEVHKRTSEYREHSQKSRISDEETSTKMVHQTFDREAHQGNSEN